MFVAVVQHIRVFSVLFDHYCDILLQECDPGAGEVPKMLSDSQRICKVIVELIETERQYVRVSACNLSAICPVLLLFKLYWIGN